MAWRENLNATAVGEIAVSWPARMCEVKLKRHIYKDSGGRKPSVHKSNIQKADEVFGKDCSQSEKSKCL